MAGRLTRESALPKPSRAGPIHVAIRHGRTVKQVEGVLTHRTVDLDGRAQWVKSPPRLAIEHAVIDVALAKQDVLDKFRVLADACQTRRTTAVAIRATLVLRKRVAGKQLPLARLGAPCAGNLLADRGVDQLAWTSVDRAS